MLRRTTALLGMLLVALGLAACNPAVATTTSVASSAPAIALGQPVTLTVTVTVPTLPQAINGTATFSDGATVLGTSQVSNGVASLSTMDLAPGTRTVTARFTPSTSAYLGSSGSVTVTVERFHLALGDSLAVGASAAAGQGYVPTITAAQAARHSGLKLRNLSCGGATTATMLTGGGGCSYAQGTQLAAAEAFLVGNPGAVSFITIDIGANDVSGCVSASGTNAACAAARVPVVQANLGQILQRLQAAAPGVPIVGMTYYNPFLAFWVTGNQPAATSSNAAAVTFNAALGATYAASSVPVAPVAEAFGTEDTALTGSWNGVIVPQNVANVCTWTRMCTNSDIHANTSGHARIAAAFLPVISALVPAD